MEDLLQDPVAMIGSVLLGIVMIVIVTHFAGSSSSSSQDSKTTTTTSREINATSATTSKSSTSKKKSKKKKAKKQEEAAAAVEPTPPEPEPAAAAPAPVNGGSKKKKKNKKTAVAPAPDTTVTTETKQVATNGSAAVEQPPALAPAAAAAATTTTTTTSKKKKKSKNKQQPATAHAPQPAADDSDEDDDDDDLQMLAAFAKGGRSATKKAATSKKENKAPTSGTEWTTISKKSKASATVTATPVPEATSTSTSTPLETDPNAPVSETLHVDVAQVPVLIGPKGATIQKLQADTDTKIDVDKMAGKVVVTGTPTQVFAAVRQVKAILQDSAKQEAHTVTLSATQIKGVEGVKAIIGRGGAQIQKIQAQCPDCRIQANIELATVTITGPTAEAVEAAATHCKNAVFGESAVTLELGSRAMVMALCGRTFADLQQYQKDTQTRMDVTGTTLTIRGDTDKVQQAQSMLQQKITLYQGVTMNIEAAKIGAIIGQGGANLRKIQERSGAQVEVNQVVAGGGSDRAECKIIGDPKAVQAAQVLVEKTLSGEVELKPGEGRVTVDLGVGASAVIGRGGSTIAELEKKHNVKLNVQDAVCTIVGKKEKLPDAKAAIEAIVTPLIQKAKEEAKIRQQAEALAASGDNAWAMPDDDELAGW